MFTRVFLPNPAYLPVAINWARPARPGVWQGGSACVRKLGRLVYTTEISQVVMAAGAMR